MESDTIAVAIRSARLYAGLTQKQVADALEKSQTTVAAWETGRSQPDAKTIVQLSSLLQVSSDFLLGISNFHNKSSEEFLYALLGKEACTLSKYVRNPLAQFTAELIHLCDQFKEIDIDLLPYAIESLTRILHILEDLMAAYTKRVKMLSMNRAATTLLTDFNAMSSEDMKNALSDYEHFNELLKECSKLNEMMESYSPKEFTGEALRIIEKAGDSIAVFALHLYAELSLIVEPPEEDKQDC